MALFAFRIKLEYYLSTKSGRLVLLATLLLIPAVMGILAYAVTGGDPVYRNIVSLCLAASALVNSEAAHARINEIG